VPEAYKQNFLKGILLPFWLIFLNILNLHLLNKIFNTDTAKNTTAFGATSN